MLVCPYQLVQRVVEVVQASVRAVEVFAPVQEVLLTLGARASVQVVVASALVGDMAAADEETLKALVKPKGAPKEEDEALGEGAAEDAEEGQANGAADEVADEATN